ncbi:MAG: cytochrome c, partial [Chloroflexi bacterium]|nr:cytochrome c [Chloroflexota bacterium]
MANHRPNQITMIRAVVFGALAFVLVLRLAATQAVVRAQDPVERGAYLAQVASCAACHSPPDGPAFSGHVIEVNGQTFYSPNLSPHESGIGTWTDDEIAQAITQGIQPDGELLHPIMPYANYAALSNADVMALVGYLRSLPTVDAPPPFENPAPPPDAIAVNRSPAVEAAPPDDVLASGQYLVDAIAACGACHTPED